MFKHLVMAGIIAVFLGMGSTGATAQDNRVTLLLKSGEKVTGELAIFEQSTVDIRDDSGRRNTYRWDDVVLLDFVGGASGIPQTELDAAVQPEQVVIMRGGRTYRGRIVDFINENDADAQVIFDVRDEGRRQLRLDQVGRIYVAPFTSEAMSAAGLSTPPPVQTGASVTSDGNGRWTVTVPGNAQWTSTGLFVRSGEQIQFDASGSIYLRSDSQDEAQPAGALSQRMATGAPIPGSLAGALIGRIGPAGRPFGIGNQSAVRMPASGELFLGVNDDEMSDNRGAYTVHVTRNDIRLRRR
jgi:small nuclear ribonucleoprotein (snRNP)-like protein